MENKNFYLVYVNPIGVDSNGLYQYDFFFSETPEIVWGEDWNVACPSACGVMTPESETYSFIKTIKAKHQIFCAQENSCFSMQDMIDGLLSLAFCVVNDNLLFSFKFSENYNDVENKLNKNNLFFE